MRLNKFDMCEQNNHKKTRYLYKSYHSIRTVFFLEKNRYQIHLLLIQIQSFNTNFVQSFGYLFPKPGQTGSFIQIQLQNDIITIPHPPFKPKFRPKRQRLPLCLSTLPRRLEFQSYPRYLHPCCLHPCYPQNHPPHYHLLQR